MTNQPYHPDRPVQSDIVPFQPAAHRPGAQQGRYQQPGVQQPGYQQPGYQHTGYQPGYQQPGYQQPGYQQPGFPAGGYGNSVPPGYAVPVVGLKDSGISYLLLIFLGGFGAHQFYLDRSGWGAVYLTAWIIGWATAWFGVGVLLIVAVCIACFVDLFLVPGYVRQANAMATGLVRPRY